MLQSQAHLFNMIRIQKTSCVVDMTDVKIMTFQTKSGIKSRFYGKPLPEMSYDFGYLHQKPKASILPEFRCSQVLEYQKLSARSDFLNFLAFAVSSAS